MPKGTIGTRWADDEEWNLKLEDELPDFLPAMVEFCWLTLPERGDNLRGEFQRKVLALLPAMRERFEDEGTPYRLLLEVVSRLLAYDLTGDATADLDVPDAAELDGLSIPEGQAGPNGGGN